MDVKNFLRIFGADELLDKKDLETKLVETLKLVVRRDSQSIHPNAEARVS